MVSSDPLPAAPNNYTGLYDKLSGAKACFLTSDEDIPDLQGRFSFDSTLGTKLEVEGYGGGYTPGSGCGSGKDAAVIFVNGDLEIKEDLEFIRPTVFIVSGKITVKDDVERINAMLINDKGFTDESGDKKLTVNGSIISALNSISSDHVYLRRKVDSGDFLSEHIILDPSYFYYASDYAGVATITYKEERP